VRYAGAARETHDAYRSDQQSTSARVKFHRRSPCHLPTITDYPPTTILAVWRPSAAM